VSVVTCKVFAFWIYTCIPMSLPWLETLLDVILCKPFQNCCHSNLNVLKWFKTSHSEGDICKSDGVMKVQYHNAEFICLLKDLVFLTNVLAKHNKIIRYNILLTVCFGGTNKISCTLTSTPSSRSAQCFHKALATKYSETSIHRFRRGVWKRNNGSRKTIDTGATV
jgi:hypothetical protein